jgi:hypothetical protein
MYDKELKQVMKSECGSRDFGVALQFLAVSPVQAECLMIEKASKGFGTNELLLQTILCGRTNKELELLKVRSHEIQNKYSSNVRKFRRLTQLLVENVF